MEIKAVLFDLDGTLLPMDQDEFVKAYFGLLAKKLAPLGYEAEKLIKVLWIGVGAMVKNEGSGTNEEAFWKVFTSSYGEESLKDKPFIDSFYREEFNQVQAVCGFDKAAKEIVELVKEKGKLPVLATNPLFPHIATENRMRWAGLQPEMFAAYTTYEDCHFCKPNPKYYEELLQKLDLKPEECIMVGNDFDEDIVPTEKLGMQVFLLTDCMINKNNADISKYPHGDFEALRRYLEENL
ncbi:MAG: HAD family hydrolase [Lachnospiraceae bacterium]|nr:HAD family hydrolase [Lachnospiraceae bacterium]MEE1014562.1 HAD family hydrolase [Lachnospiraceae bacterium]